MLSIACVRHNSPYSEGDRHPREHCKGDGDCKHLLRLAHGGSENERVTSVGLIARKDWRIPDPRRNPEGRNLSRRGAQEGYSTLILRNKVEQTTGTPFSNRLAR